MNCSEVDELGGAYALQALPQETMPEIEEHLGSCSRHGEIAELRVVALSLAGAAPERDPPPALKARVMEVVRRAAPAEAQTLALRREGGLRWWGRPRLSPYTLAAALAVAVAALLAWNLYLQLGPEAGGESALVRTLRDGGAASAQIVYLKQEKLALLTAEGLEPLPVGKTYQVWAISAGQPVSIGLFDASQSGEASMMFAVDLSGAEAVAITIEPAGGSPQPTTEPILRSEI